MFFVRLSSYWLHNVDHDHNNNDNDHHDQVNGLPLPLVALLPLHLQHPPHPQQHGRVTGRPRGGDDHHEDQDEYDDDGANEHDDDGVNNDDDNGVNNNDDDGDNQGGDAGLPNPPSCLLCLLPRFSLHHCSHHCRHHH